MRMLPLRFGLRPLGRFRASQGGVMRGLRLSSLAQVRPPIKLLCKNEFLGDLARVEVQDS